METSDVILLDGAMGTMLQAAGLPLGLLPEVWNITEPEKITAVHRRYLDAGSRVIYTNTFGVNRYKAARSGYSVKELVSAAVQCARAAADGRDCKVALDIGPTGQLMEPLGTLRFEDAVETFREIMRAGVEAGADLAVIETMSDLAEVKAAVLAVKECSSLPVWVTMTYEAGGRTFLGTTIPSMAMTLEGLGVDALGFNCSLGPEELLPMIRQLREWTSLPLILKPNAGLPDPATGLYPMDAGRFASLLREAPQLGVKMLGGCCGTAPEFIEALRKAVREPQEVLPMPVKRHGVCSATRAVEFQGVHVIGERINPTGKKRFQQALREGDIAYITAQAIAQQDAGAEILDVNVGLPGIDEPAMMERVVRALQEVVDLPLQIDSSDPLAIEAGLRVYNGKAIVNSVNGKREVLETILPLCKKYGAAVVGLCLDENGLPKTWQERVAIAQRILDAALQHGIPREDVLIDCLTLTVSAQQDQAAETLKAVRAVHDTMGLHTVLGVSNISFGLPQREQITVSFLTQAMEEGLDLPIVNPNQEAVMDAVFAFRVLSGQDRDSARYIERFSAAPQAAPAISSRASEGISLEEAILRGLKGEVRELTEKALESREELDVVNSMLIPALDVVGDRYEKKEIFLPQLINAANAACEGFDVIRDSIRRKGSASVSRGKILLATVQGDIHDIGKNIVRVVLENYGYTVLDLGRDVSPQVIVETARSENVPLIGLSALMTTTVKSMAETIAALRESGHPCKIMVGGAVLTPEYAAEIGADFYAKDAKQSADIARRVLG